MSHRPTTIATTVAALLAFAAASAHEETNTGNNQTDVDVLLEGILLPHEGTHNHDRYGLTALGQYLDGVNDIAKTTHGEEGRSHRR